MCNTCHSKAKNTFLGGKTFNDPLEVGDIRSIKVHVLSQSDSFELKTKYVGLVLWGKNGQTNYNLGTLKNILKKTTALPIK